MNQNLDFLIQDLYKRYLKHHNRSTSEMEKICNEAYQQDEILVFLLAKNPEAISNLSKKMLSVIRNNCPK